LYWEMMLAVLSLHVWHVGAEAEIRQREQKARELVASRLSILLAFHPCTRVVALATQNMDKNRFRTRRVYFLQ